MTELERVLRDLSRAPGSLERWNDGKECPSEFRLAALAEGLLGEAEAEEIRSHLAICGACLLDFQAACEELAAMEAEAAPATPAPVLAGPTPPASRPEDAPKPGLRLVRGPVAWVGLAAAAALLVFLGLQVGGSGAGPDRTAIVALAEAQPVAARVPRGEVEDSAEAAFREGLAFYLDQDLTPALAELRRAAELAPERLDVALYLGSSLLLSGEYEAALGELERAAGGAGDAGREASWQAVQALLFLGRSEAAIERLEALAAAPGLRSADAERVLGELSTLSE
ncbi:MAG: zf-HC2 domain-containing protein [Planctomycetota bacterium]